MPKACEAPASLGPGRGEAGALVDLLRVQQAGRATSTILALRSGESRVPPPRGSSLPMYSSTETAPRDVCMYVCAPEDFPADARAELAYGTVWMR